MGNGAPIHGREGVLNLSTGSGSTNYGTEIAYTNSFTWTPSKDNAEITPLNSNSKIFVEGLVSGALTMEGSLIAGQAQQAILISRFAKTLINDTDYDTAAVAITDGNMYFHGILKPIDTKGTSDDIGGQKIVVPILASGLTLGDAGADIVGFSYNGVQNGDATYVYSTDTAAGLPKKLY
jgi:hypothetical protein